MRMMGVESVAYHRETVMERADDHPELARAYYASHGETPLAWGGSGARALGLVGPVTDAQYDNVFGPGGVRDPTTGTRLVETRRPGLELVVSAHKSVALLGVIGWGDQMHDILDAETDATLAYLDDWIRASGGRRGRAQTRTPTEGLVYARTRHATSRAGDPEPHDHVLIVNLVDMRDERGGRKALDTAVIRDLLHAATMVGRLAAARRAVDLGFAIEADPGPSGKLGHWRIAGIPAVACDLFSKRSAEIEASVESTGYATYQARQVAARATRRAKRHTPVDDLMPTWRAELMAAGLAVDQVQRTVVDGARQSEPARPLSSRQLDQMAEHALGPDGRLADIKVFTRSDVIVAVAPVLYGREPAELNALVTRVLRRPEAIPLVGVPNAREQAYSPACVVAVEAAIVRTMAEGVARTGAPTVRGAPLEQAIWAKEAAVGRPLTMGQTDAVIGIATSGRGVDVVLGVAGSGKTTMLDVVRAGFEAAGYRVLGTSTSGQAARTLGRQAHLAESRTVASLLWRLEHDRISLDDRTVLIVDEAAMTDDPALLRLLTEAETAGAKTVLVGDHRQLGAVGPAGSLEGLVRRYPDAVHVMRENVRQLDREERTTLAHLRAGDVAGAVDWYVEHHRVRCAGTRADVLDQLVNSWHGDVAAGLDAAMYAWRRANVAELNRLARDQWAADGRLHGPELWAPGGRRYAAGDRIVTLAPGPGGALVTSEHGVVEAVDPAGTHMVLLMDDDRLVPLHRDDAASDKLDYGYAVTVHRSQGDTTATAHRYADGGGRELGYVSMSRATDCSTVYVVADDVDQARGDLIADWSKDRRQRWAIDTGTPTIRVVDVEDAPGVPSRLQMVIREARLRSERDAVARAIPPDVSDELDRARRSLISLQEQLEGLETGRGGHLYTAEGRAAVSILGVLDRLEDAQRRADDHGIRRSERRDARHEIEALGPRLEAAVEHWNAVAGPKHARVTADIERLQAKVVPLQEQRDRRVDWMAKHPEALRRLDRLDRELAACRPPPTAEPRRVVGIERPSPSLGRDIGGPELSL